MATDHAPPFAGTDDADIDGTWTGSHTIAPLTYGQAGTPLFLNTTAPELGGDTVEYTGEFAGRILILPVYNDSIPVRVLRTQSVSCTVRGGFNPGEMGYAGMCGDALTPTAGGTTTLFSVSSGRTADPVAIDGITDVTEWLNSGGSVVVQCIGWQSGYGAHVRVTRRQY